MSRVMIVLHPDGRRESRDLPTDPDARLRALQEAVDGYIEYLSPAYHGLQNWEVVLNDDGLDRLPLNVPGCRAIGFDLGQFVPLSGVIVLVPLERGTNAAAREAEAAFFERLDVATALRVPTQEFGAVIDAR